jgi:hypothetical protein
MAFQEAAMSEELIAQLETSAKIRDLNLSRGDLARLAELTEKLHSTRLFRRLSFEELAYIAEAGEIQTFERGHTLIEQGKTDRVFYVILEGQLRVWKPNEQGKRQLLNYSYPGDFVGEIIMLTGDKRTATVDVVEEATLVAFKEAAWERIIAHPSLMGILEREGQERVRDNVYVFSGKQLDEVVVEHARKSWVALLRRSSAPILITILSMTAIGVFSRTPWFVGQVAASVGLAIVVAMFLWFLWMWQDWRNDDYIVTSKRIIHVERVLIPPFPVERHEIAIQAIREIKTTSQGLWTLLFHVMTLEIRTMGEGIIRFPDLPNADYIREQILQTQKRALSRIEIPGPTLIRRRLAQELGREVKQVVPLASEPAEEPDHKRRSRLGFLEYFVPYTRIEGPDGITWRQHWFKMLGKVFVPVLLFFGSVTLVVLSVRLSAPWLGLPRWVWIVPSVLLLLFAIGWYLWRYEEWRNDVYIVTDSRIIDIEGSPFHLRQETRVEGTFDVIQDVTYDSPGIFFRLFQIGFVTIDTAAKENAYTFDWVSHPAEVQQEIFRRWTEYREKEKRAATERRHQEFLEWIVQYDHLVHQKE